MFKNQTPQQLSVYIATVSTLTIALVTMALKLAKLLTMTWPGIFLVLGVIFIITFSANYYLVRYFIFRRIKLIYKLIHKKKLPADFKAGGLEMQKNVLSNVEREVDEWMEENDRNIEELEKLSAYRRRFIGDVSHELKTPIFNIQGFIHTLLDGAVHDPEVNISYLHRAAKNADRLQAIVEDLETINKLESGQTLLDLREFDIHELTDEVVADLEMRAAVKNVKITYKEGAHQHFKVLADKENIRQVLTNLIHNSVKYGREGGLTKISFYDMETYILVEISDNGIGIETEHLDHVFDRFFRADKSRSRDAGGTGLGLSIVKHILEAHKQTVHVRSSPGQGSTFGFTLEKV